MLIGSFKKLVISLSLLVTVQLFAAEPNVITLSDDLERPWAVHAVDADTLLITEREGNLRVWQQGQLSKPIKLPVPVFNKGQGGLLDVITPPNYPEQPWIYVTYSGGESKANGLQLARFQLKDNEISNFSILFVAMPLKKRALHFGGRIEFLPDGTLVFGVGEAYSLKEQAQTLDNHLGKIIRLNADGSVPKDNPFVNTSGAKPEIYSYGHRNPQGLFYDANRKILFSNEHGPKGGDEINIIQPGNNYGWPSITYGVDYSGAIISDFTHKEGMEQPLLHWTPSIAPSSLIVYQGKEFSNFNGHILASALKFKEMRFVELNSQADKVNSQHTYLKGEDERLRDIELGVNGEIYLVTDSGKLLKLNKK